MNTISNVIGEGTYGCVHNPSLTCNDSPNIFYNKKVSKILKKRDAKIEEKEYSKISKVDKNNEYYLGMPYNCDVDKKNQFNIESIKKCKIGSEVIRNINDYSLLIMNDGGENLRDYSDTIMKWDKSIETTEKCEKFLLEALRLFKGLKIFNKFGLIHHDLKPQNIVFDETTNRLNFIDFGLMVSKKKILKLARESNYNFAIFHWSFPWELEYINKHNFYSIVNSIEEQEKKINVIKTEIINKNIKNYYYDNINNFFYFAINNNSLSEYKQSCSDYVYGYEHTIKLNMKEMQYEKFLNSSVNSIDVFGLGISLNYWLNRAFNFLSQSLRDELRVLFDSMIEPEIKYRATINELIEDFKGILIKNGLLEKYNKVIRDNIVVDKITISTNPTMKMPEKLFEKPKIEIKKMDETTPKSCPKGKIDLHSGLCRISKLNSKELKKCPEGKELNPRTKRCVKKCKSGYVRNERFKCVKNKTSKIRLLN